MLCGSGPCNCAFESVGLVISQGAEGQIILEPAGPGIVSTSVAVTTPFLGQSIYETSTGRFKVYDGTNWVIYAGAWPGVSAYAAAAQSIPNNAFTLITGLTEIYDSDSIFNAGTGVATIPVGMGGDWLLSAEGDWASNVTGARSLLVTIGTNTSVPTETAAVQISDGTASTFPLPRQILMDTLRLEAGATLGFYGYQNSGGALNLASRKFRLRMVRSIPSLT